MADRKMKGTRNGFLFIQSGQLFQDQIEKILKNCIQSLHDKYGTKKCDFMVVTVTDKNGVHFGHSYAWIEDREVFNALIGLNLDGTELVELVDDENWTPPDEEKNIDFDTMDWAEIDEVERKHQRPKIKKELPPLIVPPSIEYTEQQYRDALTAEEKECRRINEPFIKDSVPKLGFIKIGMAKVNIDTEKYINSIYSNDIPNWITEQDLFNHFHRFSDDKTLHINPKTNKKFKYPLIHFSERKKTVSNEDWRGSKNGKSRTCEIVFSPLNNDAFFVYNISRRITFSKKGENCILFFSMSKIKNNDKNGKF